MTLVNNPGEIIFVYGEEFYLKSSLEISFIRFLKEIESL